jgi:hypothetical protein
MIVVFNVVCFCFDLRCTGACFELAVHCCAGARFALL